MTPQEMERIIRAAGRTPRQRTTLYADADEMLYRRSLEAAAARMASSVGKGAQMAAVT
jgi:FO synthase